MERTRAHAALAPPELRQRSVFAEARTVLGQRHRGDHGTRLVPLGRIVSAAEIVAALRWVGADDNKIVAARKFLMSGACRQHGDIAGGKLKYFAILPAELHPDAATCDADRLMNHRVIVHKRIDAVSPLAIAPAVFGELLFDCGFRAPADADIDCTPVDECGQYRIVRHRTIVLEQESEGSR